MHAQTRGQLCSDGLSTLVIFPEIGRISVGNLMRFNIVEIFVDCYN
jgi:hypothetical protein